MARRSTGLPFAIRFRARHNDHAQRFANTHFNLTLLARVLAEHKRSTRFSLVDGQWIGEERFTG